MIALIKAEDGDCIQCLFCPWKITRQECPCFEAAIFLACEHIEKTHGLEVQSVSIGDGDDEEPEEIN